jgi:hypothetical protein
MAFSDCDLTISGRMPLPLCSAAERFSLSGVGGFLASEDG